jgi:putative drug exporter of the RND superfamily
VIHRPGRPKRSVVSGLVTSGRVITAAATIMVFVFGSFVLNGDPTVKQFGIGLGSP